MFLERNTNFMMDKLFSIDSLWLVEMSRNRRSFRFDILIWRSSLFNTSTLFHCSSKLFLINNEHLKVELVHDLSCFWINVAFYFSRLLRADLPFAPHEKRSRKTYFNFLPDFAFFIKPLSGRSLKNSPNSSMFHMFSNL